MHRVRTQKRFDSWGGSLVSEAHGADALLVFLKKAFFSNKKIISKIFEKLVIPIDSSTPKTFAQT